MAWTAGEEAELDRKLDALSVEDLEALVGAAKSGNSFKSTSGVDFPLDLAKARESCQLPKQETKPQQESKTSAKPEASGNKQLTHAEKIAERKKKLAEKRKCKNAAKVSASSPAPAPPGVSLASRLPTSQAAVSQIKSLKKYTTHLSLFPVVLICVYSGLRWPLGTKVQDLRL